jgi:hypothetical protein
MSRIKPGEVRQAQRFGHELVDPVVVQRYREQDQRPSSAALDHYGAMLDRRVGEDEAAFERRMELLRDAEADIAAEQAFDREHA